MTPMATTMRAALAVARRPRLWPTGLRMYRRTVPAGWWRAKPFLPVPDRDYLAFRLQTEYGAADAPDPADVVRYLEWCRRWDRAS